MEIIESLSKMIIALIPIVGIIVGGVVLLRFFEWYFEYKKFLVESGYYKPLHLKDFRIYILLLGILSISAGIPLTIIFVIVYGISFASLGGLIPFFIGVGLMIFYSLSLKKDK